LPKQVMSAKNLVSSLCLKCKCPTNIDAY
jgi:hypothetical protein